MISHIIEFLVDYFTNLNARKIIGGLLVLAGLWFIGRMSINGNVNVAVLYGIGGIIIGGIGTVVIYHDIAKDKLHGGYDELGTLTKALDHDARQERKAAVSHTDQNAENTEHPDHV
jgi:ABC-type nickel/cobalt efflux system permease component RcnA